MFVIPIGPEIATIALLIIAPVAFLYIAYKSIEGFGEYKEAKEKAKNKKS
jgi:hypothetical protein